MQWENENRLNFVLDVINGFVGYKRFRLRHIAIDHYEVTTHLKTGGIIERRSGSVTDIHNFIYGMLTIVLLKDTEEE
jgi:hypothetical protein